MPQVTPLGALRASFTDKCGRLLAGGKIYTYEENSLTPKITYADFTGVVPNTNPIVLDRSGEADIFLDGSYRFQIFDRFGTLIHDINNVRDHFKDQIKSYFVENILAAGGLPENSAADYNYLMQRLAQIAVDKGWDASFVVDGDKNQKQINDEQKTLNEDQSRKNSLTVDILEFIPKSEWPAIASRTSTYDCTPALTLAVATKNRVTISKSGTYKLNTPFVGTTDFDLEATAPDVVLDGNSATSNYIIENSGSVELKTATFTSPSKHDMSTTLSSVAGLNAGDWLCFYCSTNYSYSLWRPYYRAGEWKQIREIVGNVVSFTQPFYDSYAGLSLQLYKLNTVKCRIANLKLDRKGAYAGFVKFALSSNASDVNVTIDNKLAQSFFYDRCIAPTSTAAKGSNTSKDTGNDYAIIFGNCQHARVFAADIYATRHAVALGGSDDVCCVPVSDFRCYNSVLRADPSALAGAADMHGNVRDSSYEDCTIFGGSNIGGGDGCYIKRSKIYSDSKGVCGFGREIIGGSFGWVDCEYYSLYGDPQSIGRGVIDFGGNSTTCIAANTTKTCDIYVSGKIFGGDNFGLSTQFSKVRNNGTTSKINIYFEAIEILTNKDFLYLVSFDVVSGIAASDRIIVDNIRGRLPSGLLIATPEVLAGQTYLNFPMRLQKASGKVTLVTTASTQVISAPINMLIKYPRPPTAKLSIRGVGGVAKSSVGGQQVVTATLYNQTNTAIRPMISTPAAMTVGDNVEVMYTAEISEC